MERLTQQRLQIFAIYNQNQCSIIKTYRRFRPIYPNNGRSKGAIRRVVEYVGTHLTFHDFRPPTIMRPACSEENIAVVKVSVEELQVGELVDLPTCVTTLPLSIDRVENMPQDLVLKGYEIQLVQELKLGSFGDHCRSSFAQQAQNHLEENSLSYRKIVFSDEAHFWLYGLSINKIATLEVKTIHVFEQQLQTGGIIFFKNDAGSHIMVNGERYRAMINNHLFPNLSELDFEEIWF